MLKGVLTLMAWGIVLLGLPLLVLSAASALSGHELPLTPRTYLASLFICWLFSNGKMSNGGRDE